MKNINLIIAIGTITAFLAGCKTVDLRSDFAKEPVENQGVYKKGKSLLDETYRAMGYNFLEEVQTYEATANFDWKDIYLTMPLNSLPGNNNNYQYKGLVSFLSDTVFYISKQLFYVKN